MSTANPHLAVAALEGLSSDITWTGTNQAMVQQLIDMVSAEERNVTEPRNMLDGMLPSTRDHLVMLLTGLKASVVNV
jgi:hypothetical protein